MIAALIDKDGYYIDLYDLSGFHPMPKEGQRYIDRLPNKTLVAGRWTESVWVETASIEEIEEYRLCAP